MSSSFKPTNTKNLTSSRKRLKSWIKFQPYDPYFHIKKWGYARYDTLDRLNSIFLELRCKNKNCKPKTRDYINFKLIKKLWTETNVETKVIYLEDSLQNYCTWVYVQEAYSPHSFDSYRNDIHIVLYILLTTNKFFYTYTDSTYHKQLDLIQTCRLSKKKIKNLPRKKMAPKEEYSMNYIEITT